jgi:diguanylate cyclase (GGDEF)-like protein
MAISPERKITAGFVSALTIVLAVSAMSYRNARFYQETFRSESRTHEVLEELSATLSLVKDAETGERGFIITGDEKFLEPHQAAESSIYERIDRLRGLMADSPREQDELQLLERKIQAKLEVEDKNIQARKTEGVEAASRLVATGRGRSAMDEIRTLIGAMEAHEIELLQQRVQSSNRAESQAVYSILILFLLSVFLLSVPYYLIRRDIRERRRAEDALQDANEKLSTGVKALELRSKEIGLLSQLGNLLQSCMKAEEAYKIVAQQVRTLFPSESGALCVLSPSRDAVEVVAEWGETSTSERVFAPDDCWGLRSGRAHCVETPESAIHCAHVSRWPATCYLCVPMMAQGEALGVFHLQSHEEPHGPEGSLTLEALKAAKREMSIAVAEQIGLALANLRLRETLRAQSIRDPLTGLFNRRYMEESLERELLRATRSQRPLGIIITDLDHFKRYNDTFGHEAGDLLLRELGTFLKTQLRKEDIACRYGGEEFVLILPDASLEIIKHRAETLRSGVKQMVVHFRGQPLGAITLSVGVAAFPAHGDSKEVLLRAADKALYQAKSEGRDRVIVAEAA